MEVVTSKKSFYKSKALAPQSSTAHHEVPAINLCKNLCPMSVRLTVARRLGGSALEALQLLDEGMAEDGSQRIVPESVESVESKSTTC